MKDHADLVALRRAAPRRATKMAILQNGQIMWIIQDDRAAFDWAPRIRTMYMMTSLFVHGLGDSILVNLQTGTVLVGNTAVSQADWVAARCRRSK